MSRQPFGYLVPEYPGQTHTFFWREVIALEELGAEPDLVSTRRPHDGIAAHSWAREASARTTYLLPVTFRSASDSLLTLARAAASGKLVRSLAELRTSMRAEPRDGISSRARQIGLFMAGAALAGIARRRSWRHIHVHSSADAAQVALFAHRLSSVTYSLTLHGPLADYGPNQNARWSNAASAIVITGDLLASVRDQLGPAMPATTHVAPMGVDTRRFVRSGPYTPWSGTGRARLLSCGRLNPSKGHADLITAVAELTAAGYDVELSIAGEDEHGGNGYRHTLENHILAAGLGDRVTLLGAISDNEVRAELDRAHVFCLASHAEPLGVAIMEALAYELPVVATRAGGVPGLIDDGVTGLLVPPNRPSELASAIIRFLTDPDLATRTGAEGRKRIVAEFDSTISAAVLASLVGTSASPGSGS